MKFLEYIVVTNTSGKKYEEAGINMDILKSLSDAASAIGTKSAELVSSGKLLVEKKQLEGKVQDLMTDIGALYYKAYLESTAPNSEKMNFICDEIKILQRHIKDIEENVHEEHEGSIIKDEEEVEK